MASQRKRRHVEDEAGKESDEPEEEEEEKEKEDEQERWVGPLPGEAAQVKKRKGEGGEEGGGLGGASLCRTFLFMFIRI